MTTVRQATRRHAATTRRPASPRDRAAPARDTLVAPLVRVDALAARRRRREQLAAVAVLAAILIVVLVMLALQWLDTGTPVTPSSWAGHLSLAAISL